MKSRRLKFLVVLCVIFSLFLLAACGGKTNEPANTVDNNETPANTQENTQNETPDNEAPEDEDDSDDVAANPFGKYDPPIEITAVRIVDDTYKYVEGDSIESNIWTKAYEEQLGIKLKYNWVVSGASQGEQKMNVAIASGDLADIIPVNSSQLAQLVKADMIMDVTEVYDKYAAPLTKEVMYQEGTIAFDAATFQGKLMAIPHTTSAMDSAALVWVRKDWLDNLGLPEPKTMEDVLKISEAFTKQDPDGNGKDDTIGLAINKDLYGGYAGLEGFFNGYHAYPGIWLKDDSGEFVYGSVQPEMKPALLQLQEMYKDGQIDREFGVKDGGKVAELAASGRNGLHFGQMWNPMWPLQDSRTNDHNADWRAYPLVSIDDKPARPQVSNPFTQFYAINKDCQNPEAAVKMLNLFIEKNWGETAEAHYHYDSENAIEVFKYALVQAWPADKNLMQFVYVNEAFRTGDTSKLNVEQQDTYNKMQMFLDGDQAFWGPYAVFGEEGPFKTIQQYVNNDMFMRNAFFGAPTPTMVEKGATLSKMELEVFTKIIMGDPIEEFDKFVEDWKKLGGEDIANEIKEWDANR